MNYLVWAVVALVGYSIFTPLVSLATRDVPSTTVAVVANSILLASAIGVTIYQQEQVLPYLTGRTALYMIGAGVFLAVGILFYMIGAGVFLAVGILSYYRALAAGPVSIVTPIYGMFLVGSTILSVVFLDESLSLQKGAGIALAAVAIYLTATG